MIMCLRALSCDTVAGTALGRGSESQLATEASFGLLPFKRSMAKAGLRGGCGLVKRADMEFSHGGQGLSAQVATAGSNSGGRVLWPHSCCHFLWALHLATVCCNFLIMIFF